MIYEYFRAAYKAVEGLSTLLAIGLRRASVFTTRLFVVFFQIDAEKHKDVRELNNGETRKRPSQC